MRRCSSKNPSKIFAWVFMCFLIVFSQTHAQEYYKTTNDDNSPIQSNKFSLKKFKVSLTGGVLHNRRIINNPGPLINDKPFASSVSPNLIFELSYRHNRWLSPTLLYRTMSYFDGDDYNYYGNYGASRLFKVDEFGIGNRFYLVNKLFRIIYLSSSINILSSFISGNFGETGWGNLTIYNPSSDSIVFNNKNIQKANLNLLLNIDLLLEIQVYKNLDLGIGVAYFQGFNRIVHSITEYEYLGKKYSSDKYLYGSGIQPFIKATIKLSDK